MSENEKITNDQIKKRKSFDGLTEIFNRQGFISAVDKLLEENQEERVMVVMNVRNFKMINHLFGVPKGDSILIDIANILKERQEYGDICGRFHSDRFGIFMTRDSWEQHPFEDQVEKIQSLINSQEYHLDLVVGVYFVKNDSDTVYEIIEKALLAMRTQRQSSDTSFHFYSENMFNKAKHKEEVIAEFDDALENDEFLLFLQPQFTADGELVGTEALARWDKKHSGEILPPSRFIDILESTKRIHRLDQYIWEKAVKQLKAWENTKFKDLSISVNISPEDFDSINIENYFRKLHDQYKFDVKKLHIEITENALISSPVKFENFVNAMKESGFVLELDDFGSGYSSLNVLKNINVDTIKLDMVFVRGLKGDEKAQIILKSVIDMIKRLGMEIIVEGLETRGQLETIETMGDVLYQGYYFSKPLQVSVFEEKYGKDL